MKLRDLKEAYKTGLKGKGFKDKSQDGENRIINFIFNDLKITPRYAVEFGAGQINNGGAGTSNIDFFYKKHNCECLFFEVSELKFKQSSKEFQPMIKMEAINADNVNEIFKKYNVPENLDIVVIDVDGQDYWIWEKLEYKPKIMVIEFNPQLSLEENKVMHYDPNHWTWRDTKCGYTGASMGALIKLGKIKGYSCVFRTQRNLIFVQKEYIDINLPIKELYDLYEEGKEENNRIEILHKNPQWVIIE